MLESGIQPPSRKTRLDLNVSSPFGAATSADESGPVGAGAKLVAAGTRADDSLCCLLFPLADVPWAKQLVGAEEHKAGEAEDARVWAALRRSPSKAAACAKDWDRNIGSEEPFCFTVGVPLLSLQVKQVALHRSDFFQVNHTCPPSCMTGDASWCRRSPCQAGNSDDAELAGRDDGVDVILRAEVGQTLRDARAPADPRSRGSR